MCRVREIRELKSSGRRLYLFRLLGLAAPLFFLIHFTASAQTPTLPIKSRAEEYVFKEIKLPGDEPIRDILALVQDSRGFVWMAGKHGLMRCGHDFKIFHNTPVTLPLLSIPICSLTC